MALLDSRRGFFSANLWMDGLYHLLHDPIILAYDPSPSRNLAIAQTIPLSRPFAAMVRDVGHRCLRYRALASSDALLHGHHLDSRHNSLRDRHLAVSRIQRLATHGIRSRIRHPVYLAHLLEMLAWSLGTGLAVCYLLTAFAILTGIFMIRAEEQELVKRFGEPYLRYQGAVPALIPRF
jgi:hypothetical protein